MKLEVVGWARDHGPTELLQKKLTADCVATSVYPLSAHEMKLVAFDYLDFTKLRRGNPMNTNMEVWGDNYVTGGVTIAAKATGLSLNGDYQVTVQFTADELLQMAVEATKNWPVDYLVKRLSAVRAGKKRT